MNNVYRDRPSFGFNILGLLVLASLVVGCSTSSRYSMDNDTAPDVELDVSQLPDPTPVFEPKSRGGNKSPYTVWGKTYHVLPTAEGYQERGGASWYGAKFHGHKTSNGETYNMYQMSAAHKSLPLPTYAKVTNLDNGRSVIVRVNDRGPFHEGRIIDLSYAAAKKLGYYNKGTANVEVEAITVAQFPSQAPASVAVLSNASHAGALKPKASTVGVNSGELSQQRIDTYKQGTGISGQRTGITGQSTLAAGYGYYIQVGAFSTASAAQQLKLRVDAETKDSIFATASSVSSSSVRAAPNKTKVFHRVRVGPFYNLEQAEQLLKKLNVSNVGSPMIITRPVPS